MKEKYILAVTLIGSLLMTTISRAQNNNVFNQTTTPGVTVQKLDKMEWETYNSSTSQWKTDEKEEYVYSDDKQLLVSTSYVWNYLNNSWLFNDRTTTTYQNSLVQSKVYAAFDPQFLAWRDTFKREYQYNENGLVIKGNTYTQDLNGGGWMPLSDESNTYTAEGYLQTSIFKLWNTELQSWENYENETFTYDSQGRVLSYIGQTWDFLFETWVNYEKEEYIYENTSNAETYIYYTWNRILNRWDPYYKDYSVWSADESSMAFLSYFWSPIVASWRELTKELHVHDANKNLIEYTEYDWNSTAKRWDFVDREVYTYDAFNNMVDFVDYNRKEPYNQWVESYRESYTFNTSVSWNDLVTPFGDEPPANIQAISQLTGITSFGWNATASRWDNEERGTFFYSDYTATPLAKVVDNKGVSFYPNPTNGFLTIGDGKDLLSVEIFTISGRRVLLKSIASNARFLDISNLSPGTYLLKARTATGYEPVVVIQKL